MKRRMLLFLLTVLAALCCAIGFAACGGDDDNGGGPINSGEVCVHSYVVTTTVPPTCGEWGYTLYECSKCGSKYEDLDVSPTGNHIFESYKYNNDATCVKNGTEMAKCKNCDAEDTRQSSSHPATGVHDYGAYTFNNDATCGEDGTETAKCKNCDAKDTRTKIGTATGTHTPDSKFNTTNTVHWHSCKICSKHVDETAHIYNYDNKCVECGYTLEIDEGLNFTLSDDRYYYTVTGWNLDISNFIFPSFYNGKPVKINSMTPFYNCNFTRVVFTSGITEIPQQSFSLLSQLREVVIPETVTSIGMQAFMGCSKLTDIWCEAQSKPSGWNSGWSSYIGSNVKIHWGNEWRYVHGVPVLNSETVEDEDAHVYSKVWSTDFEYHWYEPICGHEAAVEKHEHEFDRDDLCPICGYILKYTNELTYSGNKEYTVTGLTSSATDVKVINIPSTYLGSPVTAIKDKAFKGKTSIEKVIIPNSVKTIGANAFDGCTGLKSIVIPNSVTSIGDNAFNGCNFETVKVSGSLIEFIPKTNLKTVTISDGVIPSNAFENCKKLDNVIIGDRVTSIGDNAFWECSSLTSVTIPDSVTEIGDYAFWYCSSLTSVTIPDSVTEIGDRAFYTCSSLTIYCEAAKEPSGWNIDWNSNSNFNSKCPIVWSCKNNEVADDRYIYAVIDGIRYSIKDGTATVAEQPRNITKANIPAKVTYKNVKYSVTSIGGSAFEDCSSLTSVVIPYSVTSIGYQAFYNCSVLTIYCEATEKPNGWDSSWNSSCPIVWNCNNNEVADDEYIYTVLDGIRYTLKNGIATVVRQPSNITKANIPAKVTYKNVEYSVTSIGEGAFRDCSSLTSITIPDGVTSIGDYAFYYCSSLTSITIGNGITNIGRYAFSGCSSLTNITIPNSVTSIGGSAFSGCTSLTIYCEAASEPSGWDSNWNYSKCPIVWNCKNNEVASNGYIYTVIDGIRYSLINGRATVVRQPKNITIANVPAKVTYKNTEYKVTSIGDYAFSGCSSLKSITIPDGVTSIGERAFYECSSLKSIIIPDSVTRIEDYAFYGCNKLIQIENGVSYVDKWIVGCDTTVTEVTLRSNTKGIADKAFYYCASLTKIKFKDMASYCQINGLDNVDKSKVYIGGQKLWEMTSIVIPDGVTSIGNTAFYNCSKLTSITIPDSVTSIGSSAFYGCSSLTEIKFKDIASYCQINGLGNVDKSKIYIGGQKLTKMTSIVIPDGVTSIGSYAFYDCSSLTNITFEGTKAQWNAITKGSWWNDGTGEYTIHCTDGDITK